MNEKIKILILDDEEIVGKRLSQSLRKQGCEVEVFISPIEAVMRISEVDFDIVVTDLRMKEMNGFDVLKHARKKNDRTKIIVITGYAMMDVARNAMELGAFDFINKPFKPKEFVEVIQKAANSLGFEIDLMTTKLVEV
jgi:DNA-binding NtrC family response regulator